MLSRRSSLPGEYQLVSVIMTNNVARANIRWNRDQEYWTPALSLSPDSPSPSSPFSGSVRFMVSVMVILAALSLVVDLMLEYRTQANHTIRPMMLVVSMDGLSKSSPAGEVLLWPPNIFSARSSLQFGSGWFDMALHVRYIMY